MTDERKIDFLLHIGLSGDELKEIGAMGFVDFDTQTEFEGNSEKYEGSIVECKLFGSIWMFMRIRDDKDIPNHISTYEKVMKSIQDNITKDVLIKASRDIRNNWSDIK